jgi:iron complex transport system ATP-binding protein
VDVVALEDAEVRVAGRRILGPVTLSVRAGERWAVLGPNGSGKTTLLRLAGALRRPSAGRVSVLGSTLGRVDLRDLRRRVAFVGHAVGDEIAPSLAVRDVVLTGKRATLVPWMQEFDDADRDVAAGLLGRLGCAHLDGQSLGSCSQGERQRVLLARALFGRPELLLLDEPAAGLDLPGREALLQAMEAAGDLADVPTILVTHHLEEVPTTVTQAVLLREGAVVASGPIGDVLTDAHASACFEIPLSVRRRAGRWTAVVRP